MTKICFFADAQSVHTRRWCEYFVGNGYDVHVISFRPAAIDGVQVHHVDAGNISVGGNNRRILLKIPAIRRMVRSIKPDLVHALYATSYGLAAALSGCRPFVLTALGSDVLVSPFESRLYRRLLRFVFRRADHITAMSDPMKDTMIKLGAPPDKCSTVIFGIDPAIFNMEGREEPLQFTLISTRNFERIYNIDHLLNAIALARQEIPDVRLHLIGAGTMENDLKEIIGAKGLQELVLFHGRMEQRAIADLLRKSDVFVSVSSSDGNNISLNEAMACGCFSVVSDIDANRVWVCDGINGYFCEEITAESISKAIIKAWRDFSSKRPASQEYSRNLIREKALWSENIRKVEGLYHQLLKKYEK